MAVSKRAAASLCAFLLLLNLAFFPVRARAAATSTVLTAVGLAVTVSAFLNMAGIYPFNGYSDSVSFPQWSKDALQALIDEYNIISGVIPITSDVVRSYAVGGTIAVAHRGYQALRAFAQWVTDKYALGDNQAGAELGTFVSVMAKVPFYSGVPSAAYLVENGFYATNSSGSTTYFAWDYYNPYRGQVYAAMIGSTLYILNFSAYHTSILENGSVAYWSMGYRTDVKYNNQWYTIYPHQFYNIVSYSPEIPRFGSLEQFAHYAAHPSEAPTNFSGVTADTAIVSIPAEPAGNPEFVGMQVAGTNSATTAEALEEIIAQGVQERQQPTIRPVEVELSPGTVVDVDTGAVSAQPDSVVIDEAEVVPSVAALTPSRAFVDTLVTAMQTRFPFCLVFDFNRMIMAFFITDPPEAPVFSLTFHDPFSGADYSITVDLSPWDEVAVIARRFEAMIIFAGFWLNFDKFNVLNIILGGFH